ncbi:DEAD/DEAH box helicase family protein [Acidipropionibacterium thoenii]|uniref:DEAD/DEAH box helicase family protein n=1 Tax=Acidipropionibacterium thoenii TaxID=1751 RepID=UPI003CCBC294
MEAWRKAQHIGIVQAVTGTGKTLVGVVAIAAALKVGMRCVVLVPTDQLVKQWTAGPAPVPPRGRGGAEGAGGVDLGCPRLDRADRHESELPVAPGGRHAGGRRVPQVRRSRLRTGPPTRVRVAAGSQRHRRAGGRRRPGPALLLPGDLLRRRLPPGRRRPSHRPLRHRPGGGAAGGRGTGRVRGTHRGHESPGDAAA